MCQALCWAVEIRGCINMAPSELKGRHASYRLQYNNRNTVSVS